MNCAVCNEFGGNRVDEEESLPFNPTEVAEQVSKASSLSSQVECLIEMVKSDESYFDDCENVQRDVQAIVTNFAPKLRVVCFGPFITGLALKGANVDMCFQIDPNEKDYDFLELFKILRGFLKKSNKFRCISSRTIYGYRYLQFYHNRTGLRSNLFFRNHLCVQSSKLIKFLCSVDERIFNLLFIIKYWAKIHKLTGSTFSNYALYMVAICFLQSLDDPILPPICDLQCLVPDLKISAWNGNFSDDKTLLKPVSNNFSLEELLCRFFRTVADYVYDTHVICPIVGHSVPKKYFITGKLDTVTPISYKQSSRKINLESPLCVQDPFMLNCNLTSLLSDSSFKSLREHCNVGADFCHVASTNDILPVILSTHFNKLKYAAPMGRNMARRLQREAFTLFVPCTSKLSMMLSTYPHLEAAWREEFYDHFNLLLKQIFMIDVNMDKDEYRKPGANRHLRCKTKQVLWEERDKLWKNLMAVVGKIKTEKDGVGEEDCVLVSDCSDEEQDTNECCMDSNNNRTVQDEFELSTRMVNAGHAKMAAVPILDFECIVSKRDLNTRIEIADKRSKLNYFSSFGIFVIDNLPGWLNTFQEFWERRQSLHHSK